jgi:hypothetical protein
LDFDRSPAHDPIQFLDQVARCVGGRPILLPTVDMRRRLVTDGDRLMRRAAGLRRVIADRAPT